MNLKASFALLGWGICALMPSLVIANPSKEPVVENWSQVLDQAKGQTVYFNAWGGSEPINRYIRWAADQVQTQYCVTVKQVKLTDTADAVRRVQTEFAAGRKTEGGSIDLLWVNGENFKTLKQQHLLFGPWAEQIPNWHFVDMNKPVQTDFSVPTEGYESPWGTAQLTFLADRAVIQNPPRSADELLHFAKLHPGLVSYPKPPDFHGTTFLKQLLLSIVPDPAVLQQPVVPETFAQVTKPLWDYLDQLHPYLWRQGKTFPASAEEMHRMLANRELVMSLTFNPNEGANLIAAGQLPKTAYSFGWTKGTIGNVHFLAITVNAKAKAGAMVFANFLLSPEAQQRKADIKIWGDGFVLDQAKVPQKYRMTATTAVPGQLTEQVPVLAEPHASWVDALEQAWLTRYGAQ